MQGVPAKKKPTVEISAAGFFWDCLIGKECGQAESSLHPFQNLLKTFRCVPWLFNNSLLTDSIMSYDIVSVFQNILFVGFLPGVGVVDDVTDAPVIVMVRHHPDVAFKDHNVPALPLIDVVDVGGEGDGGAGKVDL